MRGAGDSRVAPECDVSPGPLLTPSPSLKSLADGDVYFGDLCGGAPHGKGKYVWSDGCMYDGEWRRGRASGRGVFSWPSGATYAGAFRGGKLDGHGVFHSADGAVYSGQWREGRRHGRGEKQYPNGDLYDGEWAHGVPHGRGRYFWSNGNEYVGEWRSGVISGRGVLSWADGHRYDGVWEAGVPKRTGVFTLPDGGRCVASWHGAGGVAGTFLAPPKAFAEPRGSGAEKGIPRICIWESDGEAGDITCDIVDAVEASLIYKRALSFPGSLVQRQRSRCWPRGVSVTPEWKRPGQTIMKGHRSYDLMLCLQLGIMSSVGRLERMPMRELQPADFDPMEKFWMRFPPEGSKFTLSHNSTEFWWKDYFPAVFRHLRKLFGVDPADYMLAIGGDDALRELSSPGKSGSFFYLTQDDRFMIKTLKKSEVKVLIRMLPGYYQHVSSYKNSLVTRFYGVHCVKQYGGQKVRFIVMGNLFCSDYRIHRRFDLKGSSYGRTADKFEDEIDETTTLKDLDLNFVFRLQSSWFHELHEQLMRDSAFLESEGIMDYSFLVGVHFHDDITASKMGLCSYSASPKISIKRDSYIGGMSPELCFSDQELDVILDCRKVSARLGVNLPAIAEETSRLSDSSPFLPSKGDFTKPNTSSERYDVLLNFGIIDILQDYDISKKLEHAYKSLQADPNSISAVDPKLYSKRFTEFIGRIFIEEV